MDGLPKPLARLYDVQTKLNYYVRGNGGAPPAKFMENIIIVLEEQIEIQQNIIKAIGGDDE